MVCPVVIAPFPSLSFPIFLHHIDLNTSLHLSFVLLFFCFVFYLFLFVLLSLVFFPPFFLMLLSGLYLLCLDTRYAIISLDLPR